MFQTKTAVRSSSVRRTIRRRRGQGLTEYIIIVALVAIFLITAVTKFKGVLSDTYNKATTDIQTNVIQQMDSGK